MGQATAGDIHPPSRIHCARHGHTLCAALTPASAGALRKLDAEHAAVPAVVLAGHGLHANLGPRLRVREARSLHVCAWCTVCVCVCVCVCVTCSEWPRCVHVCTRPCVRVFYLPISPYTRAHTTSNPPGLWRQLASGLTHHPEGAYLYTGMHV